MAYDEFETNLRELRERGRFRSLRQRTGVDFTSNDYLGLAESDELRQAAADAIARGVPVGAGGSRLLRGNHPEHEALEAEAAAFFGAETALYFGAGYAANVAIFSTLPQRGDLIVHDELIHASVHEGLRRGPRRASACRHNDVDAFDARDRPLAHGGRHAGGPGSRSRASTAWTATAPLAELVAVADRHDAMLVIDEAHATGVLGPDGRGLAAAFEGRDNVITLHTCGKALGTVGGFVLAPQDLRDFLVNRARPFIFSTAPSPLIAAGARSALEISRERAGAPRTARAVSSPSPRRELQPPLRSSTSSRLADPAGHRRRRSARPWRSPHALQARGFDVRAIRPPTVPEGTARLRISLTLNVDEAIDRRPVRRRWPTTCGRAA